MVTGGWVQCSGLTQHTWTPPIPMSANVMHFTGIRTRHKAMVYGLPDDDALMVYVFSDDDV